jgi:signal peptidase
MGFEGINVDIPQGEPAHCERARELHPPAAYGKKRRRYAAVVGNVLFYAALTGVLIMVLLYGSQHGSGIMGYSMFTVLSGSMEREIPEGSLIIVKRVEPETIEVGDDITFRKDMNTTVTHRVVKIYEDYKGGGARGFETKGLENPSADDEIVLAGNVVGCVVFHTGSMGEALAYAREHMVLVFVLLVGVVVLCITLKILFSGRKKGS